MPHSFSQQGSCFTRISYIHKLTLLFTTYRSHFNNEKGLPLLVMLKISHLHVHHWQRPSNRAGHKSGSMVGTHRYIRGNTCGYHDPRIWIICGYGSLRIWVSISWRWVPAMSTHCIPANKYNNIIPTPRVQVTRVSRFCTKILYY